MSFIHNHVILLTGFVLY